MSRPRPETMVEVDNDAALVEDGLVTVAAAAVGVSERHRLFHSCRVRTT